MRAFTALGPSQSGKTTLIEGLSSLDGGRSQPLKLLGDVAITPFEFMKNRVDFPKPFFIALCAVTLATTGCSTLGVRVDSRAGKIPDREIAAALTQSKNSPAAGF